MPPLKRPYVFAFRWPGSGRDVVGELEAMDRVDALSQVYKHLKNLGVPKECLTKCEPREPEPLSIPEQPQPQPTKPKKP